MTIACILAAKGRYVVTIAPERTLADVVELLREKNIGVVVVVDAQGGIVGILSERDIIRAVAKRAAAAFDDAASMHMTSEVMTASADEHVHAAMERMTKGRFRHLPVVRDGRLVGLVSIGDLVKHRLAEFETDQKALRDYIAAG